MKNYKNIKLFLLKNSPVILFIVIFIIFGILSPNWFTLKNLENILKQSSYMGILATALTVVMLTGGTDLSVGSNMVLSASIAGLLMKEGMPIPAALLACVLVGLLFGCFNAFFIVKLNVLPFITTLATLVAGRGLALVITGSVGINLPKQLISGFGAGKAFGILPYPIVAFLLVIAVMAVFLRYTQTGRQIYAVGNDAESAQKAGINVKKILTIVYVTSGVLASIAGIVSVAQIGNVTAGFGTGYEFEAISASILGGTSMAGGVGTVFPGALLGTITIQMIQAGLVYMQVDLYVQPIVTALILLFAVFLDSVRTKYIRKMEARNIRVADE